MRRILGSIAAAMTLIVALMIFVDTSAAFEPDEPIEPGPPGRNISLRGVIDDLPPNPAYTGTWRIDVEAGGVISVEVTDQTMIVPPVVTPEAGDSVHVLARSEGSEGEETLVALKISVEKAQNRRGRAQSFRGLIDTLPANYLGGTWTVSGISFTVDAETMIHPPDRMPTVGMVANVVAFDEGDGTLWAMNIALQTSDEAESEVELEGTIEALPDTVGFLGTWVVDGISVTVTADTELKGAEPAIGLTAEVKGYEEDGAVVATQIKVEEPEYEEVEFEGTLLVFTETRPSVWVIDTVPEADTGEISVTVTLSTTLEDDKGPFEVGCWVEVEALQQPDGPVAIRIKMEEAADEDMEVEFEGPIEILPSTDGFTGTWVVDGISVTVTGDTELEGAEPAVGLTAEVKGYEEDGAVVATQIKVEEPEYEEVEFEGPIEILPSTDGFTGTWVVDGISVTVTADTELEGAEPAVGLTAEVKGYEEDGAVVATQIKVEEPEYEEAESKDILPERPRSMPRFFNRPRIR